MTIWLLEVLYSYPRTLHTMSVCWQDILLFQGPYLPACALGIAGTYYGVGAPDSAVNPFIKIRAKELQLFYELVYFGSSTLTKFSIAFTILRICTMKRYRYALYGASKYLSTMRGSGLHIQVNRANRSQQWEPWPSLRLAPWFFSSPTASHSQQDGTQSCSYSPIIHRFKRPRIWLT
jgi:hypothetical protein